MSVALQQAESSTVVQLDGVLDIGRAAELKALLLDALKSGREISVSLDAVEEFDVTAFQLLWAAEREAERAGLNLKISGNWREAVCGSLARIESSSISS